MIYFAPSFAYASRSNPTITFLPSIRIGRRSRLTSCSTAFANAAAVFGQQAKHRVRLKDTAGAEVDRRVVGDFHAGSGERIHAKPSHDMRMRRGMILQRNRRAHVDDPSDKLGLL